MVQNTSLGEGVVSTDQVPGARTEEGVGREPSLRLERLIGVKRPRKKCHLMLLEGGTSVHLRGSKAACGVSLRDEGQKMEQGGRSSEGGHLPSRPPSPNPASLPHPLSRAAPEVAAGGCKGRAQPLAVPPSASGIGRGSPSSLMTLPPPSDWFLCPHTPEGPLS